MRVRLTIEDDHIIAEPCAAAGGSFGDTEAVVIFPGEKYRGFKYSRLRRMGAGECCLLPKNDPLHSDPMVETS